MSIEMKDIKINNQGKNFHNEHYRSLERCINRINRAIEKGGIFHITPALMNEYKIIQYVMTNEVRIDQIDSALVFSSTDIEKAFRILKNDKI